MGQYIIEGCNRLGGKITIQGAKNSALPILAATVAIGKPCVIHNCPDLTDISSTISILKLLGCDVRRAGNTVSVDSSSIKTNIISDELMRKSRSSVIFLGALISRTGEAKITAPGGCDIGIRPIDLHLRAIQKLGVRVCESHGQIICKCAKPVGTKIALSFPSVGATENIMLSSIRAKGITTIINAACEPEIVDLAMFLNSCGARISGAGESTIMIEGTENLRSSQYKIIPDRVVAATYMAAAAVTGSEITLEGVYPKHLLPVIPCFEQAGCKISISSNKLKISSPSRLFSMEPIRTMPYPGFPTDCQAIVTAMASVADGTTLICENIFENRFKHICELNRMGAQIEIHERTAFINGVKTLQGACVCSTDLRAGAALVVAGLCANGITTVNNIEYIDRGYENLSLNLQNAGAKIKRID
ncbi:MAG: UDP-N-acetylglucosamine 1-carboxyvinyltransferase [Ruminococcus sp.]|nr:UDP-N-acetylglucosamine 1-carboxyvinyltransferase [Candidatus Copronaster equi]